MMRDKDILSLFLIFIIFLIFIYFSLSLFDKITAKESEYVFLKKEEPVIKYEELINDENSFNTYNKHIHTENLGYVNELSSKSFEKTPTKSVDNQFIKTIAKDIPIDSNLCKTGFCPNSKEEKADLPIQNIPACYILDNNKSVKLSDEFIKLK